MKPKHLLVMMSSCAGLAASVGQAQFTPLPGWPYSIYANPLHNYYSTGFAENDLPYFSRGVAGNPAYWMMRPGHSYDAVRNDRQVVTMVGEIDRPPTGSVTGDRLGYDITGLRDVNGDGFNDWAATWYYATPNGGPGGSARFNPDDGDFGIYGEPFLVDCSDSEPPCFGSTGIGKYGFVQVFSGIDNSPIGGKIWGSYPNSRLAHEIASMHDIDGDGADELIMSSNTSGVPGSAAEGGVGMVLSYTNKYNTDLTDTTRRWVSIYEIYGHRQTVQFGYQMDKLEADYNGDGQQDILIASHFYDRDGVGRKAEGVNSVNYIQSGAGWLFLTPQREVFTTYQALSEGQRPVHPQRPEVMAPLTITTEHYAVAVFSEELDPSTNAWRSVGDGDVSFMGSAGDIDGDGYRDLYVIGPVDSSIVDSYNNDPNRLGSIYPASTSKNGALFYLSGSPLNRSPWASLIETGLTRPPIYLDSNGIIQWPQTVRSSATANWQPPAQTTLHPWDTDFVFAPDSAGGLYNIEGSVLAGVNLDDEIGTDLCIFEDIGSANECPLYLIPNLPAKYRASVGVDGVTNAPLYSQAPVFYSRHDPIGNVPVHQLNVVLSGQTSPANVFVDTPSGEQPLSAVGYRIMRPMRPSRNEPYESLIPQDDIRVFGFNMVGNLDGESAGDCDLIISHPVTFNPSSPEAGNRQNRGMASVIDLKSVTNNDGSTRVVITPLLSIFGPFGALRSGGQAMSGLVSWDHDRDGRDDILLVQSGWQMPYPSDVSYVTTINKQNVTIPAWPATPPLDAFGNPWSPDEIFEKYWPANWTHNQILTAAGPGTGEQSHAGMIHLLLSPPAIPSVSTLNGQPPLEVLFNQSVELPEGNGCTPVTGYNNCRVTVIKAHAKALRPPHIPWDWYPQSRVRLRYEGVSDGPIECILSDGDYYQPGHLFYPITAKTHNHNGTQFDLLRLDFREATVDDDAINPPALELEHPDEVTLVAQFEPFPVGRFTLLVDWFGDLNVDGSRETVTLEYPFSITVTAADCTMLLDVDGNGSVDLQDFGLVMEAMGTSDPAADVTNNGIVDLNDAIAVANVIDQ